jgi:hypothetical protein
MIYNQNGSSSSGDFDKYGIPDAIALPDKIL